MSAVTEFHVLLPVPDVGLLALTAAQFTEARRLAAEVVPSYSNTSAASATEGGAPVKPEELLDAYGVAAATRTKASWWEAAARRGDVPCYQFGRVTRFRLSEVIEHGPKVGKRRVVGGPHKATAAVVPISHRRGVQS